MKKRMKNIKIGSSSQYNKLLIRNLTNSLIVFESIKTSRSKARALQPFIDRLITVVKSNKPNSKNLVYSRIRDKKTTEKLFNVIGPRFKDQKASYISIYKGGRSKGNDSQIYYVNFKDYVPPERSGSIVRSSVQKKKDASKKSKKSGGILDRVRSVGRGQQSDRTKSQYQGSGDKLKAKSRSGI